MGFGSTASAAFRKSVIALPPLTQTTRTDAVSTASATSRKPVFPPAYVSVRLNLFDFSESYPFGHVNADGFSPSDTSDNPCIKKLGWL